MPLFYTILNKHLLTYRIYCEIYIINSIHSVNCIVYTVHVHCTLYILVSEYF